MKPPIVNFTPFHSSRVEPLRRWREKDLREVPKRKIKLEPRKSKDSSALSALLPPGLDPVTQKAVLEALRKVKG